MEEKLLSLLAGQAGGVVPGRQIRKSLGISHIRLLDILARLAEQGYALSMVAPDGYRLDKRPDLLTSREISLGSKADYIGRKIYALAETDSTNTTAYKLASAGAPEGTVVISERQRNGRGRLGRRWESPAYVNIYLSVILRPRIVPSSAHLFTLLTALAAARAILKETRLAPCLSWPNDILLGGKKVGGVLVEQCLEGSRPKFLVVGLGLNVNAAQTDFSANLKARVSSLMEKGRQPYTRSLLVKSFFWELERAYREFEEGRAVGLIEEWERLSRLNGKSVRLYLHSGALLGVPLGLNEEGGLLVRSNGGLLRSFSAGEILKLELVDAANH
jgi:BirA family biotin operon repressor/biotin-[acetyl-CoA-carboxylase] ligase